MQAAAWLDRRARTHVGSGEKFHARAMHIAHQNLVASQKRADTSQPHIELLGREALHVRRTARALWVHQKTVE